MQLDRMWLFLIFLNIANDNVNSVYLNIDENLLLKICQIKFCDAIKTNVSVNFVYKMFYYDNQLHIFFFLNSIFIIWIIV